MSESVSTLILTTGYDWGSIIISKERLCTAGSQYREREKSSTYHKISRNRKALTCRKSAHAHSYPGMVVGRQHHMTLPDDRDGLVPKSFLLSHGPLSQCEDFKDIYIYSKTHDECACLSMSSLLAFFGHQFFLR